MRRLLIALGAAFIVAYGATPYVALYQLDQAVSNRNEAALDRLVDWQSVGQGLEADLEALFEPPNRSDGDFMENIAESLMGIFTDVMINPVVDFYMTPRGLAYLLNTQIILDDPAEVFKDDFPAEETWFDHISFAFFTGPGRFQATVRYPEEGTNKDPLIAPMVLEFRLSDFRWQLVRVQLPLDEIVE